MALTKFASTGEVFQVDHDYQMIESIFGWDDPDPAWGEIDAAGHLHQWLKKDDGTYETPTLAWIKTGDYWEDDDDDIGHLACIRCGVGPITPGYIKSYGPRRIQGLSYYSINGETVSKEEFTRRFEAARAAIPRPPTLDASEA